MWFNNGKTNPALEIDSVFLAIFEVKGQDDVYDNFWTDKFSEPANDAGVPYIFCIRTLQAILLRELG